jgi:hypothetical protein
MAKECNNKTNTWNTCENSIECSKAQNIAWQQIISVGFFWFGILLSVYLMITVSTTYCFPILFIFDFYRRLLDRRKKYSVLPVFILTSRFYNVFFSRPPKENVTQFRCFGWGWFFLITGFSITYAFINNVYFNVHYLKDMEVVKGSYEYAKKQYTKGQAYYYVLSFRKENGELINVKWVGERPIGWSGGQEIFPGPGKRAIDILRKYQKEGDIYTLWISRNHSMFFPFFPEFRKYPDLNQIVGDRYQYLWWNDDRERHLDDTGRSILKISMLILFCSIPFFLYRWLAES